MSRNIKKNLIIVLTSLLFFSALIFIIPKNNLPTASAEDIDIFEWTPGASTRVNSNGQSYLKYRFNLINPDYEDLSSLGIVRDWWGNTLKNTFKYNFTLNRATFENEAYTYTPIYTYSIEIETTTGDSLNRGLVQKIKLVNHKYNTLTPTLYPAQNDGVESLELLPENAREIYANAGYISVQSLARGSLAYTDGGNSKYIDIAFPVESPYANYAVNFTCDFKYYTGSGIFQNSYIKLKDNGILSETRSVSYILNAISERGRLEAEFPNADERAQAQDIIDSQNVQQVEIQYLIPIEGTPFATTKNEYVSVPVNSSGIRRDDVAPLTEGGTLDVLDSFCKGFELESNVYVAKYNKNVWLRALTTDGNYVDYFLDINNSFYDYYQPFVDDGIITNDLYEFIFSTKLLSKYEELLDYNPDEVYGYFGIVAIPNTNSINTLWQTMFDTDTSKVGMVNYFSYDLSLSFESYEKLINDYRYSWLSKAWEAVTGFVTGGTWAATYYIFYSAPNTEYALIGENGAENPEDNTGVAVKPIEDVVNTVGEVVSNVWDGVSGLFVGISQNTTWILILAIAVLGIVLIIKIKK